MPLKLSVQVKATATGEPYQPLAFGGVTALPTATGAVRSMSMPLTVCVALLPARSTAGPLVARPPFTLFDTVIGSGQSATPDPPSSAHAKPIVTGARCQPR